MGGKSSKKAPPGQESSVSAANDTGNNEKTFFEPEEEFDWPDPSTFPLWFHGDLSTEKAVECLSNNDGLGQPGRFLVRNDPEDPETKGRFVVSVVYEGEVTHHLLEQTSPKSAFTLNHSSTDDDVTTLELIISYLHEEHPNWPVKLATPIFTTELEENKPDSEDSEDHYGVPRIVRRLGSIKREKKEEEPDIEPEAEELDGFLAARRQSIALEIESKVNNENDENDENVGEKQSGSEADDGVKGDGEEEDTFGKVEEGDDEDDEADVGFSGDLADAAAEDEKERAAEALEKARQKALDRAHNYDVLVKSTAQKKAATIEIEEETFSYVPEGEVSSVKMMFLEAEQKARKEAELEKEHRRVKSVWKPKPKVETVPAPEPKPVAEVEQKEESTEPGKGESNVGENDEEEFLATADGVVPMPIDPEVLAESNSNIGDTSDSNEEVTSISALDNSWGAAAFAAGGEESDEEAPDIVDVQATEDYKVKVDTGLANILAAELDDSLVEKPEMSETVPADLNTEESNVVDPVSTTNMSVNAEQPPKEEDSVDVNAGRIAYMHGPIKKLEAEALLTAHDGDANKDGTFLIRKKPSSDGNEYIISVIFKGKPTHHLLTRERVGADWTVNKTVCPGKTTVDSVRQHLQMEHEWWPVPLSIPVSVRY